MSVRTAIALALAIASTTLANLAYLREHDAAAVLPCLSLRRPLHSLRLLLTDRSWLLGFAMETTGFALYAAALALASLALVQSIGAGGIGVLAYISARATGRRLGTRELRGVILSIVGLLALAVSLAKNSGEGGQGSSAAILSWICATAGLAVLALWLGRRTGRVAVAEGVAGGLFFSIGDLSTKLATQGGTRFAFVITLVIGYTLGTSLLQLGYQRGGALTVAGLATLLSTALPIAAGTIVLHEPVPPGVLGALRVLAFVAVTAGAFLLAAPDDRATKQATRSGGLLARRRLRQRNKVASAPAAGSAREAFPAETTARPNPTPERGPRCSSGRSLLATTAAPADPNVAASVKGRIAIVAIRSSGSARGRDFFHAIGAARNSAVGAVHRRIGTGIDVPCGLLLRSGR